MRQQFFEKKKKGLAGPGNKYGKIRARKTVVAFLSNLKTMQMK